MITSFFKKVNWVFKTVSGQHLLVKVAKCIKSSLLSTPSSHTHKQLLCASVACTGGMWCVSLYTLRKAVIASNSCIQNARPFLTLNNSDKVTPLNPF